MQGMPTRRLNSSARHSGEGRNPARKNTPRSGQNPAVVALARRIIDPLDSGLRRNDAVLSIGQFRFIAQATPLPLNADTALAAALYSAEHQLPMADSLILTAAREHQATLWTQDADLKGHKGVMYKTKPA
jgi:predicted nucleic acid-binding protein